MRMASRPPGQGGTARRPGRQRTGRLGRPAHPDRHLSPGGARDPMGRTVRAEIAPDGSLACEPSTREERLLHEMYTRGIREDHADPYGVLVAFTVTRESGPGAEPGRIYSAFQVINDDFESGRTSVMHGSDLYAALAGDALKAAGRACARVDHVGIPALPRLLMKEPGAYTHLLLSPGTYRASMGAMGWGELPGSCGSWPDADLRRGGGDPLHPAASLNLTIALANMDDGVIFCVNAKDMCLSMGGGLVTYDYGTCELEFRRSYSFSHYTQGLEIMLLPPP